MWKIWFQSFYQTTVNCLTIEEFTMSNSVYGANRVSIRFFVAIDYLAA